MTLLQTSLTGWGFPQLARFMHFFVNGRSLCHRYLSYEGDDVEPTAEELECLTCATCTRLKEERGL